MTVSVVASIALALLLALAPSAAAEEKVATGEQINLMGSAPTASGTRTDSNVTVTIMRGGCVVSPGAFVAGAAVFRIANRSGSPAAFSVVGKRTSVAPGRQARRAVTVRAGRIAYSCAVAGRRVGGGSFRVAAVPQPLVKHRIGVRDVNGAGEFYDRVTGAKFVPRGHEFVRIGPQLDLSGRTFIYHTTFNLGRYDAKGAEAALVRMAAGGYNVVTVGINAQCAVGCAADPQTYLLRAAYFANVADFIRRAKANGIYVMLGTQFILERTLYQDFINDQRRDLVDNINLILLTEGGVRAYATYWSDVVRELRRHGTPLDAIFGYEIFDEIAYVDDARPFTLSSGTIRAPNGRTYDLGSADDRRRMMDESIVYWLDRVRAAIRAQDPTALVTLGLFQPQEPNRSRVGDKLILSTRGAIERSTADFIDIHPYPGIELTLPQYMENFGIAGDGPKPIIIGEFGAHKFAYPSAAEAVPALFAWQRESCRYGIDGWLLWTWDTAFQPDGSLWNALDDGGVIEQALAPKSRPDPCG